jgi:hypothetical protein
MFDTKSRCDATKQVRSHVSLGGESSLEPMAKHGRDRKRRSGRTGRTQLKVSEAEALYNLRLSSYQGAVVGLRRFPLSLPFTHDARSLLTPRCWSVEPLLEKVRPQPEDLRSHHQEALGCVQVPRRQPSRNGSGGNPEPSAQRLTRNLNGSQHGLRL